MGRLTQVAPRLGPPPRRLAAPLGADREGAQGRDATQPWRRWYKTAAWQRLRWEVLVAAGFVCAACGRIEPDTSRLVADHIRPHRGDPDRFWARANLQCLCKACHDIDKQAAERRWQGGGVPKGSSPPGA